MAQILDINRGDKMDYLVSMASNDFMLEARAQKLAAEELNGKRGAVVVRAAVGLGD